MEAETPRAQKNKANQHSKTARSHSVKAGLSRLLDWGQHAKEHYKGVSVSYTHRQC
jgi:hypothetical protein